MPWIPRILRYNFLSVSVHFLSLSLFNGPIVFRGKDIGSGVLRINLFVINGDMHRICIIYSDCIGFVPFKS